MHRAYRTTLPRVALLVAMALPIALFAVSMPLPWHHFMPPTGGVTVVRGIDGASWLIVMSVIALYLLVRAVLDRAGWYTRWLMNITSLMLLIGIFSDYIDWQSRAAQRLGLDFIPAYFGPGFFCALAGVLIFIVANVLLWRVEV